MKKKIGQKVYDTETATVVDTYVHGNWGDTNGYEEVLYCTPDGFYFLWGKGGVDSPYTEETIRRIAKDKVSEFVASHK